jgi:hypothetical protein
LGFIDAKGPATKLFAIQSANSLVCRRITHFDETETTRAAGSFIIDQDDFINSAILLEQGANLCLGSFKRQITHINFLGHN